MTKRSESGGVSSLSDFLDVFSNEELAQIMRVQHGIAIAIHLVRGLPETISAESRALCLQRLQEAAQCSADFMSVRTFGNAP